ncbi:MAG: hypothetical protein NT070_21675 [Cyanobacteria bacterium]|nr:hypothetical protein [Cyanobacteriota bacterium]
MSYSEFKLETLVKDFKITLREVSDLFTECPEVQPSDHLRLTLSQNLNLAVAMNTEKARSEMIISPILLEIKRRMYDRISLFSGVDFTVDSEKGLNGICDFLISHSSEQLFVRAPVIALVEAKNENLKSGFAQCMAEMLAAQLFNQREGNDIPIVYGVVTIGTLWRFLRLTDQTIELDLTEYFIKDISKILGILLHTIESP